MDVRICSKVLQGYNQWTNVAPAADLNHFATVTTDKLKYLFTNANNTVNIL